ncbi:MAG: rane fusion protein multidrug efflux system [Pseudomonadota bacterium]|nr:rane fusion protein multidrug efflux system [Pseudomonadota bacterium]
MNDARHFLPLARGALTLALGAVILAGCQKEAEKAPGAGAPAASGTSAAGAASAAGGAPVAVGVVTLETGRVGLATELPGRISAPVAAEVRPQVRGIIRSRDFAEGAMVRAGQVLYRIEPDAYRIALDSARAGVSRAQATLDAARLTAQRRADLLKVEGVSQQDVQDAQVALRQAEADLASARAVQASAELNLERTTVTAPISGRVDLSTVTPGTLVTADQTTALTTVRQLDPIQVDISQSSAELLRLRRDLASGRLQRVGADEAGVKLLLEDGSAYPRTGRLSVSGVSVNTATGAVTLRARFDNPEGTLMPGMYVRAVLETASVEQALVVPQQAVQRDARGQASVLVVGDDRKVERRQVGVGRSFGGGWIVSDGLKAGERVIVEGLQKVRPGDTVQPRPVELQAPASAASAASAPALPASGR